MIDRRDELQNRMIARESAGALEWPLRLVSSDPSLISLAQTIAHAYGHPSTHYARDHARDRSSERQRSRARAVMCAPAEAAVVDQPDEPLADPRPLSSAQPQPTTRARAHPLLLFSPSTGLPSSRVSSARLRSVAFTFATQTSLSPPPDPSAHRFCSQLTHQLHSATRPLLVSQSHDRVRGAPSL